MTGHGLAAVGRFGRRPPGQREAAGIRLRWCRGRDSNPHTSREVADFKSAASTISPPRHGVKLKAQRCSKPDYAARGCKCKCATGLRIGPLPAGARGRILEATGGFEPPNRGFADLRLSPLGYVAPLRRVAPLSGTIAIPMARNGAEGGT